MRNYKALVVYDEEGNTIRREKGSVMFTGGEPHPKDRIVNIHLPDLPNGEHQEVNLSLKMLEKACGLTITRVCDTRR